MAARTAWGMFVGPGMKSALRPDMAGPRNFRERDGSKRPGSEVVVALGLDAAHRQGEILGGKRVRWCPKVASRIGGIRVPGFGPRLALRGQAGAVKGSPKGNHRLNFHHLLHHVPG